MHEIIKNMEIQIIEVKKILKHASYLILFLPDFEYNQNDNTSISFALV